MNTKKVFISIFILLFLIGKNKGENNSQWSVFSKYLENTEEVNSFDDFKIYAEQNEKEYNEILIFTKKGKPVLLNEKDTIPIAVFNSFFKNHISIGEYRPVTIVNICGRYGSRQLTEMGYVFIMSDEECVTKIFPIAKRKGINGNYEFILCKRLQTGIIFTLLFYNELMDRIDSYVTLYSSGISNWVCDLNYKKVNDVYIQTTKIENGLITQLINDGFNDLWERKIFFNKNKWCYEELWNGQPDYDAGAPIIYKTIIQDSDGFTNVREKPDKSSEILYEIHENEIFYTSGYDCNGWHRVLLYKDKYDGWIYKSRIKILSKETEF